MSENVQRRQQWSSAGAGSGALGPVGGGVAGSGGGPERPVTGLRARGAPLVQPVALAVAADDADFRSLARSGIFGDLDYPHYLHRTECQLRAALRAGVEVHLRVLEPLDFADFCAAHGLPPQSPASRVAYAADPELAGEPFVYDGAELAGLLPALVADHLSRMRIAAAYGVLFESLGPPGGRLGGEQEWVAALAALLEHVTAVYLALVAGLGEGRHRLALRTDPADPADQAGRAERAGAAAGVRGSVATVDLLVEHGRLEAPEREEEVFCLTLAAAFAAGPLGELLVYSARPRGARAVRGGRGRRPGRRAGRERPRTVRGWALAVGRLTALDADGVRELLARSPVGGAEGVGGPVRVRPGFVLPQPAAERGGEAME